MKKELTLSMTLRSLALSGVVAFASVSAFGQGNSVTLVPPHDSVLPDSFGAFQKVVAGPVSDNVTGVGPLLAEPTMSLVNARKEALEECGPKRSEVVTYRGPGGRTLKVEAVEFGDYTGAWSAYTLVRKPGAKDAKELGQNDAVADNAVLFTSGATLVVAFPATSADIAALKPLAAGIAQVHGSAAQPPLLPTYLPEKGLAAGSVRYALGAATYAAQGGVLPAASIGWDKSAEAITAHYVDRRGDETLTLLLYPTPQITAAHLKTVQGLMPNAASRKEAELVMLATGSFAPEQAQKMLENIHMKQQVAFDRTQMPEFSNANDVPHTYSLLHNIAILSCFLMAAAVLLGLFFGGGRAIIRVLRGQDAAMDVEFLSLKLANQNAKPQFGETPKA
jgi:hypothetical protein